MLQFNRLVKLTISMQQVKKDTPGDIKIDLCVPAIGDRDNLWAEGWGKIQHDLTERISNQWNKGYTLYSSEDNIIKSKHDFIDVVSKGLQLDEKKDLDEMKHNDDDVDDNDDDTDAQHISFVIKVK